MIEEAPESELNEVGIDWTGEGQRSSPQHFRLNYYKRIKGMLHESLIEHAPSKPTAASVATLKVTIQGMRLGAKSIWGETRPHFAASFQLTDPASGKVLFDKAYRKDMTEGPGPELGCSPTAACVGALYQAINDCTSEFVEDARGLKFINGNVPDAPFDGTLVDVTGEVTRTRENFRKFMGSPPHTAKTWRDLVIGIPNRVITQINQKKLFSLSDENEFSLKIMVMDFYSYPGAFLIDKSFRYKVDNVLYRNGKEIASERFDSTKYTKDNEQVAYAKHMEMLMEFLKKNAQ